MPQSSIIYQESDHRLHAHLWSVLIFPRDSELREQAETVLRVTMEIDGIPDENNMVMAARDIRKLARSMSEGELTKKKHQAIREGLIAGDLLLVMYWMYLFNIEEPSMNKAIYLIKRSAEETRVYGDGEPLKTSEKTIRKYWTKYKPVAHLWAAMEQVKYFPIEGSEDLLTGRENIKTFLGLSAVLLNFGATFIPYRSKSKTTLLDYSECWTLPEEIYPIELDAEKTKFPSGLAEYLKGYKAP